MSSIQREQAREASRERLLRLHGVGLLLDTPVGARLQRDAQRTGRVEAGRLKTDARLLVDRLVRARPDLAKRRGTLVRQTSQELRNEVEDLFEIERQEEDFG